VAGATLLGSSADHLGNSAVTIRHDGAADEVGRLTCWRARSDRFARWMAKVAVPDVGPG